MKNDIILKASKRKPKTNQKEKEIKMDWNKEVLDYLSKVSSVGFILGILAIGLSDEPMTCKKKFKNLIWSVVFAIGAGFLMKHLEAVLPKDCSVWVEWLLIGLATFNQRAIRFLAKITYHKLVMNPVAFVENIRRIIKGDNRND